MTESYVVDASVGIKMFLKEEEYSADVKLLFISKVELYVPDLFHIECTNILWKRVTRGIFPRQIAAECISDLYAMQLPTTPTAGLMSKALQLALTFKVTPYDACYVALAELLGIPLLTADIRLRDALINSHIQLLTIPEYLASGS